MRSVFLVVFILTSGVLAACSGAPYPPPSQSTATAPSSTAPSAAAPLAQPAAPQTEALAPPDATERAVAPVAGSASQDSASGDSGWVSSYPYGAAQGGEASQTAAAAENSEVSEEGGLTPGVSGWMKPNVTSDQRRADIEACYRYAWSQVEHDMRIDSDVESYDFNDDSGLGFTQLTKRMNLYDYRKRRTTLINDCMESKGYSKG